MSKSAEMRYLLILGNKKPRFIGTFTAPLSYHIRSQKVNFLSMRGSRGRRLEFFPQERPPFGINKIHSGKEVSNRSQTQPHCGSGFKQCSRLNFLVSPLTIYLLHSKMFFGERILGSLDSNISPTCWLREKVKLLD